MAHTPTPWKLEDPASEKHIGHMVYISPAKISPYRGDIAHLQGCENINGITDAEAMANAAFIVRAVNAHEPLVEALSEMVDLMEGVIEGDYKPDSFTTQPARAALSLAKGEAEK